jgi:hypothetical protein
MSRGTLDFRAKSLLLNRLKWLKGHLTRGRMLAVSQPLTTAINKKWIEIFI